RLGISWSPDKNATWNLHAHAGMFAGRLGAHNWSQLLASDGVERVSSPVSSPACPGAFDPNACTPLSTGTTIHTIRARQPNFSNEFWAAENLGFSKTFPKKFTFSADYYIGQIWHASRSQNVNSPLNDSPTGPRPGPANLNILELQSTGRGYGNVEFMRLEQHSFKRVQFFVGAVRVQIVDDTDDSFFFSPQTTGSNAGEYARRTGNPLWNVFGNASLSLPWKLQWSGNFNGSGNTPFNITT